MSGQFESGTGFGISLTLIVLAFLITVNEKWPLLQRKLGHDQGVCDMACGSRAEVITDSTQLRCICGKKHIRVFARSAQ